MVETLSFVHRFEKGAEADARPLCCCTARRWTNMTAFTEEVSNARIWAGFH
jgi:hypothetical protein